MSIKVMTRVWEHSKQKGSPLLLTLALADFSDDDGLCFPGIPKLSAKIRMSKRNTERLVDRLEATGEIYREIGHGRGNTTQYAILTSLSVEQIQDILIQRFEMAHIDANLTAIGIIEKRRQVVQKGDKLGQEKATNSILHNAPSASTGTGETGDKAKRDPSLDPSESNTDDLRSSLTTSVVAFQDVRQHWHSVLRTWDTPNMVYIGRSNATHNLPESIWHNPYRVDISNTSGGRNDGTREEVLAKYKAGLLRNRDLLRLVSELRGKTLVCWCKPYACHGDVLVELAALPDTELQALIDAATPKAKPTDILRDKLYKRLDDGRYEGPYGPYSNVVKAGGAFVQGEVLPPDAVIVTPTRPRDPLFDAIATHVLGAKDHAAISAVGWRVGQILHGDKRTGRCEGLLAYECERQGKAEVDRQALAEDVPLFWKDFKQGHPDLELKDCAKFMEYWVKWRGKVAATPIQVSFIEHDDYVAPSEVK